MSDKVTAEQLKQAQRTIIEWFFQENGKNPKKPITLLDTTMHFEKPEPQQFRLLTFFTFWGRDEVIEITQQKDERKEQENDNT